MPSRKDIVRFIKIQTLNMIEKREKVSVVMPVGREDGTLPPVLAGIFDNIPAQYEPNVVLAACNYGAEKYIESITPLVDQYSPKVDLLDLGGDLRPRTFALAYLAGLQRAVRNSADYIIEMDPNGAHDPRLIPEFILGLKQADVVLSTRFSNGGGIKNSPLQRGVVSLTGTVLANLVLGLGGWRSDMTSGYEAFRRQALEGLFADVPIETWVSVNEGPGYFYQTEIRTLLDWRGHSMIFVPIVWGTGRTGEANKLPLKTLISALEALVALRSKKGEILKKFRHI